jgi:hypothetical protein
LHRWQARLNLPSMELRAVVGKRQFEIAAHGSDQCLRSSLTAKCITKL